MMFISEQYDARHAGNYEPVDGCVCLDCDERRVASAHRERRFGVGELHREPCDGPVLRLLARGLREVGWECAPIPIVLVDADNEPCGVLAVQSSGNLVPKWGPVALPIASEDVERLVRGSVSFPNFITELDRRLAVARDKR